MKKIIAIFISSLVLLSCTEDFITKEPLGVGSNLTFYDNPGNCELAVNAIYDPLGWEDMYTIGMLVVGDMASDDTEKGGGNSVQTYASDDRKEMYPLVLYTQNVNNAVVRNLWNGYYISIARANAMLGETGEFVNGKDSVVYKRMRGEARFVRALCYFDLVRIFGPVPLLKATVPPADAVNIGNRASGDDEKGTKQMKEIYDYIISELTEIQNDLPWTYSAVDQGRASRGAVRALLAKAYLYKGDLFNDNADYAAAYQTAKSLIDACKSNGVHKLEPVYHNVFDMDLGYENSPEILFAIQYVHGSQTLRNEEGSIRPVYTNPRYYVHPESKAVLIDDTYGYGFNMPRKDLVDQFEVGDPRLDLIMKQGDSLYAKTKHQTEPGWIKIGFPSHTTGYYCIKGSVNFTKYTNDRQVQGKNIPVIRYADVLLIAAEAGIQSGQGLADAKNYLEEVRKRARDSKRVVNAPDFADCVFETGTVPVVKNSVTLDDVRNERRLEFFGEGQRYFDVVRWGKADEIFGAIKKDVIDNPVSYNPATLGRLPIPQAQIILHSGGKLIQNPGY